MIDNWFSAELNDFNGAMQDAIRRKADNSKVQISSISVTWENDTPKVFIHYDDGTGNEYGGVIEIPVTRTGQETYIRNIVPIP